MRGLWGTHCNPREIRFRRLARSHGVRRGNCTENGPPRRGTFLLKQILPRVHQPYDGPTEWETHRRGQLAGVWRSAISEVEEAANQGENGQQVEGKAGEEAKSSRSRAAPSGRGEADPPIRRGLLEGCQWVSLGGDGQR